MSKSKLQHAVLTCGFTNLLDRCDILASDGGARRVSSSRVSRGLRGALVLATALSVVVDTNAHAITSKDSYILYFHSKIQDYRQFQCGVNLYSKESNWNPSASNHGHYGIPQMNNKRYRSMDPYSQIDGGIKYIKERYKHDGYCEAWHHWRMKGWH